MARTKAAFLADVARREFSFDLFEIEDNDIRVVGETAIVAGRYRNVARVRGYPVRLKHARHLRVYVNRGSHWGLLAHQATEIAPGASCLAAATGRQQLGDAERSRGHRPVTHPAIIVARVDPRRIGRTEQKPITDRRS